jgi:hypothetical protein
MYYITLDLEWNQAYAQKALAVQRQLSLRLRGEVIQIGAVKLDSRLNICGGMRRRASSLPEARVFVSCFFLQTFTFMSSLFGDQPTIMPSYT